MRHVIADALYLDDDPASPIYLALLRADPSAPTRRVLTAYFRGQGARDFQDAERDAIWAALAALPRVPAAPAEAAARRVVADRLYLDERPGAVVRLALRDAWDAPAGPVPEVYLWCGEDAPRWRFDGAAAGAVWAGLVALAGGPGTSPAPVPAPPPPAPAPGPAPPVVAPPGPGAAVQVAETPRVLVRRPGLGDALVLMLAGRTGLDPAPVSIGANGADVYLLAMAPGRGWSISLDGRARELAVDDRGYAWLYVPGPATVTVSVASAPRGG